MIYLEYQDLIGVPFIDGGRDSNGYDCWGLAKEMFFRQNISVDDYDISAMHTVEISTKLKDHENEWEKIDVPIIGCLVLMRLLDQGWANHVGIYLGNNKFIHSYQKTGVVIDKINRWHGRVVGYYWPKVKK